MATPISVTAYSRRVMPVRRSAFALTACADTPRKVYVHAATFVVVRSQQVRLYQRKRDPACIRVIVPDDDLHSLRCSHAAHPPVLVPPGIFDDQYASPFAASCPSRGTNLILLSPLFHVAAQASRGGLVCRTLASPSHRAAHSLLCRRSFRDKMHTRTRHGSCWSISHRPIRPRHGLGMQRCHWGKAGCRYGDRCASRP